MAYLAQAKTEEDVGKMSAVAARQAYITLADNYNKILNGDVVLCHKCNQFIARSNFYTETEYASGVFPICKKCLLAMVEQRNRKSDKPRETKESVQKVLRLMDRPYLDEVYESACSTVSNDVNELNRKSPWLQYIVMIKSLPQWDKLHWADSEFGNDSNDEDKLKENSRTIKNAKKRFGFGYSNQEYMFLEEEYQDWIKRYQCENKAQELLFKRICFKELDINKAQKEGRDTKELDKTLQELMASMNLKPSQNTSNALTEAKTFGQLIQKWENEKPIPECEEEFKDIDKIGLYIDVFFKGHLSKMMGLKNAFSHTYERFINKYTVNRPQYDEDSDSEALFDQIFGTKDDDL